MDTKIKIIVVILFLLLGYNIYQYFISIEGWSDSAEAAAAASYDISVSPGVEISLPELSGLDAGKTYTPSAISFTQSADAAGGAEGDVADATGAQILWTSTGLAIGDDGSITGTTLDVNIDGVFAFQFTETPAAGATPATGATPVNKYLKIKITPENTDTIGISNTDDSAATAISAAGGSGSCSNGQEIDDEVNPCLPSINERDQDRVSELLGTCNASDGTALRGLAPPSLQTAVDNAQAEVDRAQADYDSAWYFDGGEKEVLDEAKAELVKTMENKERGTPPVTKRLCDEKGGSWVPSPPEDSAQNACTALQVRKAEIAARLEQARIELKDDPTILGTVQNMWDNSTGPGEILNNIVDTAGGSAAAKQVLADVLNVDISSLNFQSHSAQCNNLVTSVNTNELRITSDNENCSPDRISERINEAGGSFKEPQAHEPSGGIDVSDISQTITGENKSSCILDSMISSNIGQTSTIDNNAMMSAVQNMTGGGKIDSSPNACVDIDITQSACSYIKDKQCCQNEILTTRSNILEIGGECPNIRAKNINQMVDVTNIEECSTSDTANIDNTQTQTTKVNPDSSSDESISFNIMLYAGIFLSLCFVAWLAKEYLTGGKTK